MKAPSPAPPAEGNQAVTRASWRPAGQALSAADLRARAARLRTLSDDIAQEAAQLERAAEQMEASAPAAPPPHTQRGPLLRIPDGPAPSDLDQRRAEAALRRMGIRPKVSR